MPKAVICKPPDWGDPKNLEAYSWCINHGVTIGIFATTPGFYCGSWEIEVTANGKKIKSPNDYSKNEIWDKVFELYRFYYNKYN